MPRNLFIALLLAVLLASGFVIRTGMKDSDDLAKVSGMDNTATALGFSPRADEMLMTGNLDCLPLASGEPLAEGECVMGLKGDDGKFYALDTLNMEEVWAGGASGRVNVIGSFAPADTTNEEVGGYSYDGVLTVRAIQSI